TWSNPAAIVYGTALSDSQLNATVAVVGPAAAGALTYSPAAGTVLHAGLGQVLRVTAAATLDYNAASVTVTIDVTKATLSIQAQDASRVYGTANPAFGVSYSGFVNGENLSTSGVTGNPTVTTTATAGSAPGTYAVTVGAGT